MLTPLISFCSLLATTNPNVDFIIKQSIKNGVNPYEMLAISYTESRFDQNVISRTGDVGLFQINCRVWHKSLGFRNKQECLEGLKDPEENFNAALFVLSKQDRYRTCKGLRRYNCYNGGPGWMRSKNRKKIEHYRQVIVKRRRLFQYRFKGKIIAIMRQIFEQKHKKRGLLYAEMFGHRFPPYTQ